MPSTFGWVDFLAEDRQKMLDVVHLFREQDTRDELGLGTIRDAFSDHFFPGTSTVQTRVRYMLFVPWMYQRLEERKIPSAQVAKKARGAETWLIDSLQRNETGEGIIGSEAGKGLKRLPSNIYWSGLGAWGIRLFDGSQEEYHRSLDAHYRRQSSAALYAGEADDDLRDAARRPNWHPGLPKRPKHFPEGATFALTREEAVYLKDRILTRHSNALFAALLRNKKLFHAKFPWQLPAVAKLPARLREDLVHAQNTSEVMHGASLLYNLILSRMRQNEKWISRYEKQMGEWADRIRHRKKELMRWHEHMDDFWNSSAFSNLHISLPTKRFVGTWVKAAVASPGPRKVANHRPMIEAIRERESALKGNRARARNPRALELWRGRSETRQFNYRWPVVSSYIRDILKGLCNG